MEENKKLDEFKKLDDQELDLVSGGTTIDYTLNYYCPFHLRTHSGINKIQECFEVNGALYPTYYCTQCGQYYFEASNGYFDQYGEILVQKV